MKDYYEILNRKTPRDNWADSLQSHADSIGKPMNKNQAAAKAIYGGFAAGLRNDMDREAKLKEIEEDSRQMAMLDRELKMATGKNQLKKEKYNLFLSENYAGLMQLSDLMQKGEDGKVDILGPELFANFSKIMGEDLGKFQHYKNGYFNFIDKKGEPRTINSMNLLQPLIASLPDDQKQNFKGFLTPLQMKDIDRMYEEKQLKIDKYRADIDASKASVEASKAHAELYKAQAKEALRKAEIGTLTDKEKLSLKTNITKNRDYVEKEILPKLEANEKVLTLYDKLGNIVKENPNLVGSDYVAKVRRTIGEVLGLDPALDYAKMTSIDFEKTLRPILGAQFTEKEGNRILGKYPSIEKNITALKQFLKEERPALIKNIVKQKAMYTAYNKDNSANILDENLLGDLNSEYKNYISGRYGSEAILEVDNKDVNYKKLNNIKEKLGK